MNSSRLGPATGTDFDGTRLTVARRLRRMTKAALASEVGVTATAIAQYEKGGNFPTQGVLNRIALCLQLPREFFGAGKPIKALPASSAHFRSLRSTSSAAREQALAYGELSLELVDLIESYLELPSVDLPDIGIARKLDDQVIANAARETRAHWGITSGPIPSMVQLLEANGAIVLRLPQHTDAAVDAFSSYQGKRPLVFLSPLKNDKARSRFDAAHELGHLLLHPDTEPGSKLVERQADRFASELLMPAREIRDQLPTRIDWPSFHELKRHWGVSLRALVYRAHYLGRLSDASYRRANQQLSIWGYPEPGPLGPAESPQLLGLARKLLDEHGINFSTLLSAGRIAPDIADELIQAGTAHRPKVQLGERVAPPE